MSKSLNFIFLAVTLSGAAFWAAAQERTASPRQTSIAAAESASSTAADSASSAAAKPTPNQSETTARLEGERRFKANCGRCHAAPHKFPPRMTATIVRHMRVRSAITEEDARLILHYMNQ